MVMELGIAGKGAATDRKITILSIDGGGMRGIIPAKVLASLEEQLQILDGANARVADYFDVIAGTSTGAIITAMLTTDESELIPRPRKAENLVSEYCRIGPQIFTPTINTTNDQNIEMHLRKAVHSLFAHLYHTFSLWLTKIDEKQSELSQSYIEELATKTTNAAFSVTSKACSLAIIIALRIKRSSDTVITTARRFTAGWLPTSFRPAPTSDGLDQEVVDFILKARDSCRSAFTLILGRGFLPWFDGNKLREEAQKSFRETKLVETKTHVVIPCYDITHRKPVVFSDTKAKEEDSKLALADVVSFSASAPVYFKPQRHVTVKNEEHRFVDGGVAVNNPTLLAIREASKLFKEKYGTAPVASDYLVLSLGTGKEAGEFKISKGSLYEWFLLSVLHYHTLLDLLMDASSDMVEIYTAFVLDAHLDSNPNYLRIQHQELQGIQLSDATKEGIEALKKAGKDLLERKVYYPDQDSGLQISLKKLDDGSEPPSNEEALKDFAKSLSQNKKKPGPTVPRRII